MKKLTENEQEISDVAMEFLKETGMDTIVATACLIEEIDPQITLGMIHTTLCMWLEYEQIILVNKPCKEEDE